VIGFGVITTSQLALGMWLVALAAGKSKTESWNRKSYSHSGHSGASSCVGQPLPPVPYDAYRLCIFVRHRTLEVVYTSISLFYGARNITWGSGQMPFISTDPAGDIYSRFPRVLVDDVLGVKMGGGET